ncbi:MAG: hypothetical protein LAT81_14790 [Oceanicaulis sp.]|nr:hypothetical protein [Oceanicaulis sp.]
MDLTRLSKQVHEANKAKGFYDKSTSVAEKLMLVNSELCEALEADRNDLHANISYFEEAEKSNHLMDDHHFTKIFKINVKDTFEDELADALIRILDLSGALNIDIQKHVELKLRYNKTRPYKHGKNY